MLVERRNRPIGVRRSSFWTAHTAPIAGVSAVSVDLAGKVWLAGAAGATVYDGSGWTSYRARNSGLANDSVSALVTDADGGVWLGALRGPKRPGGIFVRGTITEPLGLPSPTISGFSPASGAVDTVVTIVGTNFDPRGYLKVAREELKNMIIRKNREVLGSADRV